MSQSPNPPLPRLSTRPFSLETYQRLELLDNSKYGMPGSFQKRSRLDPRLTHLSSLNTKESDEIYLYEHLATVRIKDGPLFVAFRESMDALLNRQTDTKKYPEWLMKSTVKKTELKIHIARILRKPVTKYDNGWLQFLEDEKLFDTICYYLLQKGVFTQEMYGQRA